MNKFHIDQIFPSMAYLDHNNKQTDIKTKQKSRSKHQTAEISLSPNGNLKQT